MEPVNNSTPITSSGMDSASPIGTAGGTTGPIPPVATDGSVSPTEATESVQPSVTIGAAPLTENQGATLSVGATENGLSDNLSNSTVDFTSNAAASDSATQSVSGLNDFGSFGTAFGTNGHNAAVESSLSTPMQAAPVPGSTIQPPHHSPTPVDIPTPVHPVINPSVQSAASIGPLGVHKVAATEPIMMPEPAPVLDPVEEELNSPMKAAAPAPGSIGSAFSGPIGGGNLGDTGKSSSSATETPTKSVAFNDPANIINNPSDIAGAKSKKTNKTSLILLIVVAAMVVIGLIAVLLLLPK